MRGFGEYVSGIARRAAALAESRLAAWAVFGVGLAVWWSEALVIPLAAGRDFGTYLGAYTQLLDSDPIDPGYVVGRTPIASVVVGGMLDVAGGALAEPVMSLLYAASVTAWFVAARSFGGGAALLTAIVLVAWPGYGILFHELSSDPVYAAAFAGWSLLAVRVLLSPTPVRMGLLGLGVGLLALVRPGSQVLVVLALHSLAVRGPWRVRLLSGAAFAAAAALVVGLWAVNNGTRYGIYAVARGGNVTVPFWRALVTDRIVRPSNGPASRDLARAVQRDLLPEEPYRSYGITLDEFFAEATPRVQEDLVLLSDRLRGWDSNGRWLREVGIEAVRAHPGSYARGVATSLGELLTQSLYRPLGGGATAAGSPAGRTVPVPAGAPDRLPEPSEGELIPAPNQGGVATRDWSIYTVWTSPTEHRLVFVHPGDEERYAALHRRMGELAARLPERDGNPTLALRLNQASRWYPPPALWLAIGILGLVIRRPARVVALSTPALAALALLVLSALGLPAVPHYAVPVAPAFILLAAGALLAPRRQSE